MQRQRVDRVALCVQHVHAQVVAHHAGQRGGIARARGGLPVQQLAARPARRAVAGTAQQRQLRHARAQGGQLRGHQATERETASRNGVPAPISTSSESAVARTSAARSPAGGATADAP
jgi:hypothetical protein